jgi:hypothetical protein
MICAMSWLHFLVRRHFPALPGTGLRRLLAVALVAAGLIPAAPARAQAPSAPPAPVAPAAAPAPAAPAAPAAPPASPTPSGPVPPAGAVPLETTVGDAALPVPAPAPEMQSLPPSPLLQQQQSAQGQEPSETDPRALSDFRPTLDPYGYWIQHPSYGLVWVPRRDIVGDGFSPYVTNGHWELDTTGQWVWASDYPFGSVVFHYGRWAYVSDSGWIWVPGYRYAPAWVQWRVPTGSYAYVGWAPLPPDYGWFGGVSVSLWWGYPTPWVFCPSAYAFHHHVDHYIVRDRVLVSRIAASSTRYVPAQPRRRAPETTRNGPSPSEARIPYHSMPRQRIRAVAPADVPRPAERNLDRGRPAPAPQFDAQRARVRERSNDVERSRPQVRPASPERPARPQRRIDAEPVRRQSEGVRERAPRVSPIRPHAIPKVRRPK